MKYEGTARKPDKCSHPDCKWKDTGSMKGAYIKGKFYCPTHTKDHE